MQGAGQFVVNTAAFTPAPAWAVENCLTHLNGWGFHHFELTPAPGFLWPGDMDRGGVAHFQRFLAGHRLRIVALNATSLGVDITAASDERRATALDLIERMVRLGGDIGARGIVLGVGRADPSMPAPPAQLQGHLFRALDRLTEVAAQAGTALWIENLPLAWETSIEGVMQLLANYGCDQIGVVYDVANGWSLGEDPVEGLRRAAGRLELVQLSDTSRQASRHDRVGAGTVPFEALPAVLAEIGYADWPALEIIDADPGAALAASIGRLLALGFGAPPAVTRTPP